MSSQHASRTQFPFGLPDGSPRGGDDDPLEDFRPVGGRQFELSLGMPEDDRRARVLVGRSGAGKTLYLRLLQRAASRDSSLYADAWQTDHVPTSEVIRIYDLAPSDDACSELWERIWRRSVFRSVASHLLCADRLTASAQPYAVELRETLADLGCSFRRPSPPSHQVEELLLGHKGLGSLERYLRHPSWHSLEAVVEEVLVDAPLVCLYLDALDEHFESAPRQWLSCQLGLCRLVLHLAAQSPRIHVVIAIRDLVYSTLLDSERATRYRNTERIRTLDWNYAAIGELLRLKLLSLPENFRQGPPNAKSEIKRWLATDEIYNSGRSPDRRIREDLQRYLLRHTRLIPRDLVQLGNAICDAIYRTRGGDTTVDASVIHDVVSTVARDAGAAELLVVANHITTTWTPLGSARMGNETSYPTATGPTGRAEKSTQHYVRDYLVTLIKAIGEDRFTRERFQRFLEGARAAFGDIDIASLLWQRGLVGYIDAKGKRKTADTRKTTRPVFYSAVEASQTTLSPDHFAYAFHPIMIDAVPLKGVGEVVEAF